MPSARRERYIGEGVFACGSKRLSASPMPRSLVTFLAEQESNIHRTIVFTRRYTILQQRIEKRTLLCYTVYNYVLQDLTLCGIAEVKEYGHEFPEKAPHPQKGEESLSLN